MSLLTLPKLDRPGGTVHVIDGDDGYEIGHESSSGASWGGFCGPYQLAETAIAAAYALARETYGGCNVSICPAALADVQCGARLPGHHTELGAF